MNVTPKLRGFNVIELMVVIAILAIIVAITKDGIEKYFTNSPNFTIASVCVGEVQEDRLWLSYSPTKLRQLAMAFTPPPGVELNEIALQNTREACFDRIIQASADAARSQEG